MNEHRSALHEALEFEKAIALADSMTDPEETLIIVTADHSQPLVINGYPERGTDVRGKKGRGGEKEREEEGERKRKRRKEEKEREREEKEREMKREGKKGRERKREEKNETEQE